MWVSKPDKGPIPSAVEKKEDSKGKHAGVFIKSKGCTCWAKQRWGNRKRLKVIQRRKAAAPENAFDSQQGWRRRRRYLLCCGLSQGEVISSRFRRDFCHEVSADLHDKFIYGYWKKEKSKKNPNMTTQWGDSIKQTVTIDLISLISYEISAIIL